MTDPFLDEDNRVLTLEAFLFVLNNELKRAVRSQNYLTLLLLEPTPAGAPPGNGPHQAGSDEVMREVARLVSREVRETDLLAQTGQTQLAVVLLDADLPSSMGVVDRLDSRFRHYAFTHPLEIGMGAACCPTHGADAETLRRAAEMRPVHSSRADRGNASNVQ